MLLSHGHVLSVETIEKRNLIELRLFPTPAFEPKSRLRFCAIRLKSTTLNGASGIGGILLHAEKRGWPCHFTARIGSFFRVFKHSKVKALRVTVATAQAARDAAERRIHEKPNTSSRWHREEQSKVAEAENRAAKAEAELAQTQKERPIYRPK